MVEMIEYTFFEFFFNLFGKTMKLIFKKYSLHYTLYVYTVLMSEYTIAKSWSILDANQGDWLDSPP